MAALHTALSQLRPLDYDTVPHDRSLLATYLESAFISAQTILDSVPPPPPPALATSHTSGVTPSTLRTSPLDQDNIPLQKEWGKPLKLAAKDNPLGMSVYKMSSKDGNGAWFARRSVHEGLGYSKWLAGLKQEFPESLAVRGGPGEGNIRGIGADRRVESFASSLVLDEETEDEAAAAASSTSQAAATEGTASTGVGGDGQQGKGAKGMVQVYHLSAQFPGPTTPRDFVEMLFTSESAFHHHHQPSKQTQKPHDTPCGRHFLVISRPCNHPEVPPRDGYIRGVYESVEYIREIPRRASARRNLSRSQSDDAHHHQHAGEVHHASLTDGLAPLTVQTNGAGRNGRPHSQTFSHGSPATPVGGNQTWKDKDADNYQQRKANLEDVAEEGEGEEEDESANAVEWIMVTRSDPGGSVPRFMVERGTPAGIVSDAGRFLDWTAKKRFLTPVAQTPAAMTQLAPALSVGPIVEEEHHENGEVTEKKLEMLTTAVSHGPGPSDEVHEVELVTQERRRMADELLAVETTAVPTQAVKSSDQNGSESLTRSEDYKRQSIWANIASDLAKSAISNFETYAAENEYARTAISSIETYAPAAIVDKIPASLLTRQSPEKQDLASNRSSVIHRPSVNGHPHMDRTKSIDTTSSIESYASAEEELDSFDTSPAISKRPTDRSNKSSDALTGEATPTAAATMSSPRKSQSSGTDELRALPADDKEFVKLRQRKLAADEKLLKHKLKELTRARAISNASSNSSGKNDKQAAGRESTSTSTGTGTRTRDNSNTLSPPKIAPPTASSAITDGAADNTISTMAIVKQAPPPVAYQTTPKVDSRIQKVEEKHAREMERNEERYRKDVAKLQAKRAKTASREDDKRKKEEEKSERHTLRTENTALKTKMDTLARENAMLQEQVGQLQKENTLLVARMGAVNTGAGGSADGTTGLTALGAIVAGAGAAGATVAGPDGVIAGSSNSENTTNTTTTTSTPTKTKTSLTRQPSSRSSFGGFRRNSTILNTESSNTSIARSSGTLDSGTGRLQRRSSKRLSGLESRRSPPPAGSADASSGVRGSPLATNTSHDDRSSEALVVAADTVDKRGQYHHDDKIKKVKHQHQHQQHEQGHGHGHGHAHQPRHAAHPQH